MKDISSRIVEREEGPRRPRAWVPVLAALVLGLASGYGIGAAQGADPAELDAARERAVRAERQVIFLRGERDRLNGQISDQDLVITALEKRVAEP